MEIIGSSKLVNPDDSINEVYNIYLTKGMHYLLIKCNTQSSYKILIQEIEPTILTMNEEKTKYSYSINGDGTGHFIQDSNNYYSIDLVVDQYTFILNNTEFTDFQMDLYYQNWTFMTSIKPTGLNEDLVFIFNSTESQTVFINIRGSQESGYFTLKVIGKSSGNQGIPFGLIISFAIMAMLPIVFITKRKKKKD
jgi:hypothetical protein